MVIDVLDGWIDYLPYLNIDHTKMFSVRTYRDDFPLIPPWATGYKYLYYAQEGCSIPAGSNVKSAIYAALTQAYQHGEDVAVVSFDSSLDFSTALMSIQNICNGWRFAGKQAKSYRYYYTPESKSSISSGFSSGKIRQAPDVIMRPGLCCVTQEEATSPTPPKSGTGTAPASPARARPPCPGSAG